MIAERRGRKTRALDWWVSFHYTHPTAPTAPPLPRYTGSKVPPSLIGYPVQATELYRAEKRQPAIPLDASAGSVVALELADPLSLDKPRGRKPAQGTLAHLKGIDAGSDTTRPVRHIIQYPVTDPYGNAVVEVNEIAELIPLRREIDTGCPRQEIELPPRASRPAPYRLARRSSPG